MFLENLPLDDTLEYWSDWLFARVWRFGCLQIGGLMGIVQPGGMEMLMGTASSMALSSEIAPDLSISIDA